MSPRALRGLAASLACLLFSGTAAAQGEFAFDIDPVATSFSWSGTTSLGDIVALPPDFTLHGTTALALSSGGAPVSAGQYLGGGDALVVPDLHGEIPNPIPILPPLAEIDIVNLHFVVSSDPFSVAPDGSYDTLGVATVLQGTLIFDPLIGDTVTSDLAGFTSDPASATGSVGAAPGGLDLTLSIDLQIGFVDPDTGVSGSVSLDGTLVADFGCPAPANYCQSSPNSAGPGALLSTSGSTGIVANDLTLAADGLPPFQPGIFYYGPQQIAQPFGDGIRCVGGTVVRLPPLSGGAAGAVQLHLDQTALPTGGAIEAGDVVNFQFWYRDPAAAGAGFNFSDALEIFFCP